MIAVLPVTSGARSLSWMSRGACRQADLGLFFPVAAVTGPAGRRGSFLRRARYAQPRPPYCVMSWRPGGH